MNPEPSGVSRWSEPLDRHNLQLISQVSPASWVNPTPAPLYDLVVIGAGTAGLVTALGAAGLGARVALVERHRLGGDCLNTGCVPSKALIRSAHAARQIQQASALGMILGSTPQVDFPKVMERVREIRALIAPHDSAERVRSLGVDLFLGNGRFEGGASVRVGPTLLSFKRAVIATGARPAVPDILRGVPVLTSDTVFNLTRQPGRVAVIGGGPIGCELGQALRRLGAEVTLFQPGPELLPREDTDAAGVVQAALTADGITLRLGCRLRRAETVADAQVRLRFADVHGVEGIAEVDVVLAATGRVPNVESLGLDAAGIDHTPGIGVTTNEFLQTTNPAVFACGDVCMKWKFTHAADAAARIVIQNALFAIGPLGRRSVNALQIPWCTYTDPELARIGLSESEAQQQGTPVDTYRVAMSSVDRAVTDGDTRGFVKILTQKGGGRILGATVVCAGAGDIISEIAVAMNAKLPLGRLSAVIHPYPTRAEAIRKCGDLYQKNRLSPTVKAALGLLRRLQG